MLNTGIYKFIALCGIAFFIDSRSVNAAVGSAIASGHWNNNSTWSFGGVNRVPVNGDTVNIASGYTVSVAAQNDYTGSTTLIFITVGGTLQFTNGNKLSLPCNSTVDILSGGLVKKATAGGGNSTFIEICGTIEWKAGDGPLPGPVTLGGNTLPIELLYFKAELNNEIVDLYWATSTEMNNDYFSVERSENGKSFDVIFTMRGAGNSSTNRYYSLVDNMPLSGTSYYRLKQTDFDGKFSYSPIVAIRLKEKDAFDLKAVSAEASSLALMLQDPKGGVRSLTVSSMDGKIVTQANLETQRGINRYLIPGIYLKGGIYTLTVQTDDEISSLKFIQH